MPSFLDLPGEVRNMIYEYCLVVEGEIVPYPAEHEYPRFKPERMTAQQCNYMKRKPDVALLQVNKQIREETCPLLYARNLWRISGTWDSSPVFEEFGRVKRYFKHIVTSLDSRDLGHAYCDVESQTARWKYVHPSVSIKHRRKKGHTSRALDLDRIWFTRMDFFHGDESNPKIVTVDISNSWCPFGCCRMFENENGYSLSYFACSVILSVRGIIDEEEARYIQREFRKSEAAWIKDSDGDPSSAVRRLGTLEKEIDGSYTLKDNDEYRLALVRELQNAGTEA
ncbi:MAG: hypothetical protein Q9169_000995 [Polycauliona sp. 2 TL-2023]